MKVIKTQLPDLLILEPRVFGDDRGFFFESLHEKNFAEQTGQTANFVQDNHSKSQRGVLRGLHYQKIPHAQGKLVRVIAGEVFDVVVDLRSQSTTLGQWHGELLSAENKRQLWVPPGFAHGFLTLSESAEVLYKTTDYYAPDYECCIAWNDPQLAITWHTLPFPPILSAKDQQGVAFDTAELFE